MKDVIQSVVRDHTAISIPPHEFKYCPVAEQSDVDIAEKNAKDFAGWLAAQAREELAGAVAALNQQTESRLNQLRESKPDLTKVQELACRIQELEVKLEFVEKGSMKTIRADLEDLESRVKEIMAQILKQSPAPEPSPPPIPDGSQHDDMEIGLKKVELNLGDAVERIGRLEQRPLASDKTDHPSTFWQRVRWLFRGP